MARNIVSAGLAEKCQIQIAYAIGVAEPVSLMVETFNTGEIPDFEITEIVRKNIDLTPSGIIDRLDLRKPIYQATSAYGHFGRTELGLPWEQDDLVKLLK